MSTSSLAEQVHSASRTVPSGTLELEVRHHLDRSFHDLDFVLGHAGPSNHASSAGARYGKRKRTVKEEIDHWERDEAAAARDVSSVGRRGADSDS
jgi:hypothetical protein